MVFHRNGVGRNKCGDTYQLLTYHVHLDKFYYCPHLPKGIVEKYAIVRNCRKPKPGLLLKAAKDLYIDIHQSWMIGDILNDVEAWNDAGCRTILIDNGNEAEWMLNEKRTPHFKVKDLRDAAEIIIKEEKINGEVYSKRLA